MLTVQPSPQSQKPTGSSAVDQLRREGVEHIIFDLDQTLLLTKFAHKSLIIHVMGRLGEFSRDAVLAAYDRCRGMSYPVILEATHAAAFPAPAATQRFEVFHSEFYRAADAIRKGEPDVPVLPLEIVGGAPELLQRTEELGFKRTLCTGSPRPLVEAFLAQSGLRKLMGSVDIVASGDLAFEKRDPQYWAKILAETPREKVAGFDDHPHSVECLLQHGGVGKVFVLPSAPVSSFDEVVQRFPGRVQFIAADWREVLNS